MSNPQINSTLVPEISTLDVLESSQNNLILHLTDPSDITIGVNKTIDTSIIKLNNQGLDFSAAVTPKLLSSIVSSSLPWNVGREAISQQKFSNVGFKSTNSHEEEHEDHEDFFPVSNAEALTTAGIITNNATPDSTLNFSSFDFNNLFKLHSNPNAKQTIYLDFDGHTTVNTSWNSATHPTIISPAFDTDGNAASFSVGELQTILGIWQRVTEDFAPFEVNVTTEAPSIADLQKSGSGDTRWGIRALMTQNINLANNTAVFGSIGGVAYLNSFNSSIDLPLFAFNKGENNAAMTASHEVGHSLGLNHDGQVDSNPLDTINDSKTYHSGFGSGETSWGSLLGAPFNKSLTQWSKGEYQYANNTEDDLAIITTRNGFGYRVDDYGNSNSTATSLTADSSGKISAFGMIERNTDKDVFAFSTDAGNISLNIAAASRSYISDGSGNYDVKYLDARGSNIDLWAGIYSADGSLVAESNPADLLSASFTNLYLNAGSYYLQIDGVGKSGLDGYSDYGSLGQYAINGTLINRLNTAPVLSNPLADVAVNEDSVFTWTLAAKTFTDSDAGDILSYTAKLADGSALPAWLTFDAATQTLSGTPGNSQVGSIEIKVVATDAVGSTAEDTFSLTVQNINDAPILVAGISDQTININTALNFTLPTGAFVDVDAGDVLLYTATLANGEALPSWLKFNSVTKTFTGQPTLNNVGAIEIKVLVSDAAGAQVSDNFVLSVKSGFNEIRGSAVNDQLSGSSKADYIQGLDGDDKLYGLGGNDYLYGGAGNDYLEGGNGNDLMNGGAGVDTFVLNAPRSGVDTLSDFTTGVDKISIAASLYGGGLAAGNALLSGQLLIGTGNIATTSAQRFIYKNTTGELFFDGDGSLGLFTAQKVATFSNLSALSTSDFLVV